MLRDLRLGHTEVYRQGELASRVRKHIGLRGVLSRRTPAAGAAALLVISAILIFLWQGQRVPALSARDTVVVSEFDNRTGDAIFDGALTDAFSVQLRQSPFVNILPEQQLTATLRLMQRDVATPVTAEIAREVCQRNGGKATLGGRIARLGAKYVLTLQAARCADGAVLSEEQTTADSKKDVLTALSAAAADLRRSLGESLASGV